MIIGFIRTIMFWIDKIIYNLIVEIYSIFLNLSETMIISTDTIKNFSDRIYAIIGVFMLFKVTFSLLNMFVDPDKLTDSKAGGGVILKRIMVSLILIVTVPFIFDLAFRAQTEILNQNIIGNIILGTKTVVDSGQTPEQVRDKAGERIAVSIFSGFFSPRGFSTETGEPNLGTTEYDDVWKDAMGYSSDGTADGASPDIAKLEPLVNAKGTDGQYLVNYSFLVSTVSGIFAAWILLMFCFDVAIRSVKLGFLQLFAPISILTYIDVKKGDEALNKWIKASVSTYIDLFARLAIIFFGVFVISELSSGYGYYDIASGVNKPLSSLGLLTEAFVILGILLFMKEAPDLAYNLLGIQKPSGFTLNPMDRVRQAPIAGRLATELQARAGGAYAGYKAGQASGNGWRGAWVGQKAAAKAVASKVSFAGDKTGKSVQAFNAGAHASYKDITGQDFANFSRLARGGEYYNDIVEEQTAPLKLRKNEFKMAQTQLDFQHQDLSSQRTNLTKDYESGKLGISKEEYEQKSQKLRELITTNRAQHGDYETKIKVVDDQIKDIKTFYRYDESNKRKVDEIISVEPEVIRSDVNKKIFETEKDRVGIATELKDKALSTPSVAPTPQVAAAPVAPAPSSASTMSGSYKPVTKRDRDLKRHRAQKITRK